jgi:hypothetical protein
MLVALSHWTPGPVREAFGGNTTFTTSTTQHTTYSTAEGCTPHTDNTVTTTQALGPTTICVGDLGAGGQTPPNCSPGDPFYVSAGNSNINTNTHTETYVCSAEPIPTLSEWAQIGMASLLIGGGLLALRHRRRWR